MQSCTCNRRNVRYRQVHCHQVRSRRCEGRSHWPPRKRRRAGRCRNQKTRRRRGIRPHGRRKERGRESDGRVYGRQIRRLDVAFNNAGVEWKGPLDQAIEAEYHRVFDINVWGVLNSMRHEIPVMLKNGGGAIVNNSSVAGHVGLGEVSIYIASKQAVEGLTKSVALEFARRNVRINAVAPGVIATDMFDRFADGASRDQITSMIPVGRMGVSEEIAAAVLYLCSDDAKFTTGTSLVVDGGWIAQ